MEVSKKSRQWLFVFLAAVGIVGFALATPLGAGADEPRHLQTAWALSPIGLVSEDGFARQDGSLWPVDPNMPWDSPCFAGDNGANAGCSHRHLETPPPDVVLFNYPPVYYWIVGAAANVGDKAPSISSAAGARLGSLILNGLVLVLVATRLARVTDQWGLVLALILPPAAGFQMAVVNSSGLEISSALLFAVTYYVARKSPTREEASWTTAILPAMCGVILAWSRPLGMVWLFTIWIGIEILLWRFNDRKAWPVLASPFPGLALGSIWVVIHPPVHPVVYEAAFPAPGVKDFAFWTLDSMELFAGRLLVMSSEIGWNDTAAPSLLSLVVIVLWISFFAISGFSAFLPSSFICFFVSAIVLLPTAIEVVGWADYPQWWQPRYSLPVVLALSLVAIVWVLPRCRRMLQFLLWAQIGLLGIMVCLNALRYAFGLNGFLPLSLSNPETSVLNLSIALSLGVALVVASLSGLVLTFVRSSKQSKPGAELTAYV